MWKLKTWRMHYENFSSTQTQPKPARHARAKNLWRINSPRIKYTPDRRKKKSKKIYRDRIPSMKNLKKNLPIIFGVAISVLFLWRALRGLKLDEVGDVVAGANYIWLVPGVLVYFIGVWIRAWRWHFLLKPLKEISTKKMFPIVTIGYMGNNIFPARLGEVLRAVFLKRREEVPISASLATIIVERIFDGVVMLAFVFLNLSELTKLTGDSGFLGNIQQAAIIGTSVFIGALVVFLLAAMFPKVTAKIGTWFIIKFLPAKLEEKMLGFMNKFLDGLISLRSPANVLMVFFTSAIIWLLETGKYWFVMHAFNFKVSFFALMLMNGIVNLATTIPSAPGYVGTFDLPGIAILTAYGIDHATAASYTLVLHAALWLPITLLGLYYFFLYLAREDMSWKEVFAWKEEVEKG